MAQRQSTYNPAWVHIGIPIVQWLTLSGVMVMLALVVSGGGHSPEPTKNAGAVKSPFSIDALRDRLPPEGIERVQKFINYYRKNRRRGLSDGLARSTRYVGYFKRTFREAGLPEELSFLPLIESGFIEHAISPSKAVGVWQFIEETGRRYNLKTTRWSDAKRDPFHSVKAASKYLGHLYEKFQDWELALAAYNSGEGTVYWAVRANKKAGLRTDFWSLDLPDETQNYVPAFLAAMLIAKNPEAYGFHEIKFMPEMVYDRINVDAGIGLWSIAQHLQTDVDTLRELNPELVSNMTPPGKRPYLLRIPAGIRGKVPLRLADYDSSRGNVLLHRVVSSATIQQLAQRFRASPNIIKKLNRIDSDTNFKPGSFVIIPL